MLSNIGRKVIFVYPPETLKSCFLESIFKNEFEIYFLNEIEKLIGVLDIFSNAIVFFNIDKGMDHIEWVKYIETIKSDKKYKDATLGVVTRKDKKSLHDTFLMDIGITGGFIIFDKNQWETVELVNKILEANEARGRRQSVRLDFDMETPEDKLDVKIYSNGGYLYKGIIKSFSALGLLVELYDKKVDLEESDLIDRIVFYIGDRDHHVQGYLLKKLANGHYFLNFEDISDSEREYVQSYIFNSLQKSFSKLLNKL